MVKFPQMLSGLWPFKQAFNGLVRRIQTTVEHMRVTNASGGDMVRGEVISLTAGKRQAVLAGAAAATGATPWAGIMTEPTDDGETGISRINGYAYVLFEEGLTLDEGDNVYLSETAGRATNVEPSTGGSYVQKIGIIGDISPYDEDFAAWVWIPHCCTPTERPA
jgi:hypothetical protein